MIGGDDRGGSGRRKKKVSGTKWYRVEVKGAGFMSQGIGKQGRGARMHGGELAGGMMHGGKGECMGLSDIRLKLQMADYLLAS